MRCERCKGLIENPFIHIDTTNNLAYMACSLSCFQEIILQEIIPDTYLVKDSEMKDFYNLWQASSHKWANKTFTEFLNYFRINDLKNT